MIRAWPMLSRSSVFTSKVFELVIERRVSPRTQQPLDAVVLESADWVNVIGLTAADEVVMIRQFRFGTAGVTLEIPGGIVDRGEAPIDAARRELREETGFAAARVTPLGACAPNPALHRNHLHSFLAEDCVRAGDQIQDPGEDIAVELIPLAEIDALLAAATIDHALVAVAFQKLALLRAGHRLG